MTPAEIQQAGERLYGVHWRQPLATRLDVDVATVRRWLSGTHRVPGPARLAIRLLVQQENNELTNPVN